MKYVRNSQINDRIFLSFPTTKDICYLEQNSLGCQTVKSTLFLSQVCETIFSELHCIFIVNLFLFFQFFLFVFLSVLLPPLFPTLRHIFPHIWETDRYLNLILWGNCSLQTCKYGSNPNPEPWRYPSLTI